jgi:hypothetical protein
LGCGIVDLSALIADHDDAMGTSAATHNAALITNTPLVLAETLRFGLDVH